MVGVSSSLGVEGPSSSLHFRDVELTTGLALVDLVEVVLAEVGLPTVAVEAEQAEGSCCCCCCILGERRWLFSTCLIAGSTKSLQGSAFLKISREEQR